MSNKTSKKKSKSSKLLDTASFILSNTAKSSKNPIRQELIPSMTEFKAKIKAKNQKAASSLPKFPMPYKVKKAKKGKIIEKPKNPYVANKVVDKIVKSKKYSYVKRAMNPKSPTINKNETLQTKGADGILFPTIRMNRRGRLKKYGDKQAMKIAKQKKDAISITDIAPTYVSTKDVSLALSKRIGKSRGAPPKKGPTPQGLKIGALSNIGCPHRENGVQGSDIKGVKPIQTTGKKFIGVK